MPLGGYKEMHRPDGGITLSGVIPGTDTELEHITTDTMRALAPENKLVDSALAMRQQIEQHMQPGPDRDRAIDQLKSDATGYDAHIVIVEKTRESGNVLIKDPANKSMYEMTKNHFKDYWNGRAVKRDSL
ncbi:MAG TPA: hypothetical protein PKD05_21970 [Candidatus Melainabacteria bacterium]|mgnify:CR=1 FL=1|nr:hypothetical protein [Candidatus Melainabacteria bacterium]HMP54228.1 hypothetical protein [Candidatus Melainabacteria bacterium]